MKILKLNTGKILKIAVIFIFGAIFCQRLSSQSITWQRTYERNNQLVGNDACQTSDGNFVITGATLIANHGYSIFVMKINGSGDTLWTRTVPNAPNENDVSTVITETEDGGVVIAGRNDTAWTCKFDNNGKLIWYKKYLLFYRYSNDIIKTDNNGFLICGYISNLLSPAFILKIDSAGNFEWEKTFSTTFIKEFYSVIMHTDGYVLTGYEIDGIGLPSKMLVLYVNNQGDSLWQKSYNGFQGREIIKHNHNYYVGCTYGDSIYSQIAFMKVNLNGDSIYTRKFPDIGRDNWFASFNVINNNIIFAYEQDSSFGLTNGIGLLTDTNGNIIKKTVFTSEYFRWGSLRAIVPILNGDILFAGSAQLLLSGKRVVYCVRSDSLLNSPTYIGINSYTEISPKDFKLFNNYPNPFNSSTVIKYEIMRSANIKIEIYDILGKLIAIIVDQYLLPGKYEIKWYVNNKATGIYFLKMSIDKLGFLINKMILIK